MTTSIRLSTVALSLGVITLGTTILRRWLKKPPESPPEPDLATVRLELAQYQRYLEQNERDKADALLEQISRIYPKAFEHRAA